MKKFFDWCKKYISIMSILVIAFLVYTLFYQQNSIVKYMEYNRTIDSLSNEIKMAKDTLEYYSNLNVSLSSDPETNETEGRERFNMSKEGEDVYVFRHRD